MFRIREFLGKYFAVSRAHEPELCVSSRNCKEKGEEIMKKISVREVETLKTTRALYAHGCVIV